MRFFKRKADNPSDDWSRQQQASLADAQRRIEASQAELPRILSSRDPAVYDAPLGLYLDGMFENEPPIPSRLLETICDGAIATAAQHPGQEQLAKRVDASAKSACVGLCRLLEWQPFADSDRRPVEPTDLPTDHVTIARSVSVIAARFVGSSDPKQLIATIHPFGVSAYQWRADHAARVTSGGGKPNDIADILSCLRVALWSPNVDSIPVREEDLNRLVAPSSPRLIGDLGLWVWLEWMLVVTTVLDFAPRLKRLGLTQTEA